MRQIKIASVFGTRPEAIKMAHLVKKLEKHESFDSKIIITAQHRHMLDQVLDAFEIKPDFDLNIMKERQTISYITSAVMSELEKLLAEIKPDLVLVHGDTTTTFAAALAAFYSHCGVGHVEAGLRSFDKYQPYPEEMNRKLTTSLADLHFAPTELSRENLLNEGVNGDKIFVTGNTAIDAISKNVREDYVFSEKALNSIDFSKKIIAMTAHRRENLGQPLIEICEAVNYITETYEDTEFVYAVHKNPAVTETVYKILGQNPKVHLVDPLDVSDMHNLINKSYFVVTDSGGLQEESPSLNKPVAVLRNVTERPEGLEAKTLVLAGCKKQGIIEALEKLLVDKKHYDEMKNAKNPYGDGRASDRIIDSILFNYGMLKTRPLDYSWK